MALVACFSALVWSFVCRLLGLLRFRSFGGVWGLGWRVIWLFSGWLLFAIGGVSAVDLWLLRVVCWFTCACGLCSIWVGFWVLLWGDFGCMIWCSRLGCFG